MRRFGLIPGFALALAAWAFSALAMAEEKKATIKVGPDAAAVKAARQRGIDFLKTTQADDGSWTSSDSPGITGLVTISLLRSGVKADDPTVAKALKKLSGFIQKDGGIYFEQGGHQNYETSICLLAFQEANAGGQYDKLVASARDYLKKIQWDEEEDTKPDDVKFGGAGYGKAGNRPDLSNTSFLLDALKAAGVGPDDPAMKNAVIFVSRCQNLESPANTTPFAAKVNDGGFYYTPAAGGQSQAGPTENGGLRSYGSMTYAGLKSMIFAGVGPDDPRVKAAVNWLKKHYSVKENPGMGQTGVYYYYHTFAKALDTMHMAQFEDADGKKHDWRKELGDQLMKLQKENGSWVNAEKRWMEADPNMATAYALMTLVYCSK